MYEGRLSRSDLYSLEFRRMRSDLTDMKKMLRGFNTIVVWRMFGIGAENIVPHEGCRKVRGIV